MSEATSETQWVQTVKSNIQNPTITRNMDKREMRSLLDHVDKFVTEHAIPIGSPITNGLEIARSNLNR